MLDEGYIKFNPVWEQAEIDPELVPVELLVVRDVLYTAGLVGIYPDNGIGFGNVSMRLPDGRICISGSATGGFFPSTPALFSLVDHVDLARNMVYCRGTYPASSETMTHSIIYDLSESSRCVLHVHSLDMWNRLKWVIPTTRADVAYGTVAMAAEVGRLFREERLAEIGLMVMAGHEEGLVAFGESPKLALQKILDKM